MFVHPIRSKVPLWNQARNTRNMERSFIGNNVAIKGWATGLNLIQSAKLDEPSNKGTAKQTNESLQLYNLIQTDSSALSVT